MPPVKLYWPALLVATIASFLFEALWFSVFMNQWLAGIGRSREWLMGPAAIPPAIQFGTALLCSLIVGIVLTLLIQATGSQTAKRGVILAILVWVGFIATSWAKEYIFEVRTLQIFAINTGYALLDLMLIGAIVGGWKPRRRIL
jgi:hypothetical protein